MNLNYLECFTNLIDIHISNKKKDKTLIHMLSSAIKRSIMQEEFDETLK